MIFPKKVPYARDIPYNMGVVKDNYLLKTVRISFIYTSLLKTINFRTWDTLKK